MSMKFIVLVVLCAAMSVANAFADDGVFRGAGGTVILSRSDSVRMVAEEVVLDLTEREVVHTTCLFVVTNGGNADSLLVGFPDYWPDSERDCAAGAAPTAIYDLQIMVDGSPVVTKASPIGDLTKAGVAGVPGPAYNQAHVWWCSFAPGQTRILRTEYRHRFSTSTAARYELGYVLTTGASWAGTIDQIVVRIQPGDLRIKHPWHPADWKWTGDAYVWTASDIEPTEDIAVGLDDPQASAMHLKRNWLWHREVIGDIATEDMRDFMAGIGFHRGCRPEFLQAVCVALGDSTPELRRLVEEYEAMQLD
jgi:hypothetical protein